jgi:hypothetical protein
MVMKKQPKESNLRMRLKEGAIRRFERDRNLAEEWFGLEDGVDCETPIPRSTRKPKPES